MSNLVTPNYHNNDRVERLQRVVNALLQSSPVNLHSTIVVIAPRGTQRLWMHAESVLHTGRHFVYVEPRKVGMVVQATDHQVVFVTDDIAEADRPAVLTELKKLNMDLGHRMFLTFSVDDLEQSNSPLSLIKQ
jgi:hypothetical protein